MAFPQDPGRPPGEIRPLELQVPDQGNVGPRAMLPLVPAREQQNHDVLQHAGLGHGQHDDDINMNLEDVLPLQQVFDLNQHDAMLEDGNRQLREQFPQDPGRPPGEIRPLELQVPDQGNVGPRATLPLVPAREQQNHDVLQHAGLGHGQHDDDINMNIEDMLPLQQVFDLDQHDAMLEDGNRQLREQNHIMRSRHMFTQ